jgi:hypothetical protein
VNENDLCLVSITRAAVENNSLLAMERQLESLSDSGKNSFQSMVIEFDGYNDERDQIYEIPSVRKWVYEVFMLCPHLLYFVSHYLDSHLVLLACLGDVETSWSGPPTLTPREYLRAGIDPVIEAPRRKYEIRLADDTYARMALSLQHYGRLIGDPEGASVIITMINTVTHRDQYT